MNASRISKIAGVTLVGFVVASVAADKGNLGPIASQVAGVLGAALGTLAGGLRARRHPESRGRFSVDENPPKTGLRDRGPER